MELSKIKEIVDDPNKELNGSGAKKAKKIKVRPEYRDSDKSLDNIAIEGDGISDELYWFEEYEDYTKHIILSDGTMIRVYINSNGEVELSVVMSDNEYRHDPDTGELVMSVGEIKWVALADQVI